MKVIKGDKRIVRDIKEWVQLIQIVKQGDPDIRALLIRKDGKIKILRNDMNVACGCAVNIIVILRPLTEDEYYAIYPCIAAYPHGLVLDFSDEDEEIS